MFSGSEDSNALKKDVTFPKTLPVNARDLIAKLLVRDPTKRLGCGGGSGDSRARRSRRSIECSAADFARALSRRSGRDPSASVLRRRRFRRGSSAGREGDAVHSQTLARVSDSSTQERFDADSYPADEQPEFSDVQEVIQVPPSLCVGPAANSLALCCRGLRIVMSMCSSPSLDSSSIVLCPVCDCSSLSFLFVAFAARRFV